MTVSLHQESISRLEAALTEALMSLKVDYRRYLDYSSVEGFNKLDNILPTSASIKRDLIEIFGDEDHFREFSIDWVGRHLKETQIYQLDSRSELLSSLETFHDLGDIANRIVKDFCALPYRYVVTLPLPETLSNGLDPFGSFATDDEAPSPRLCEVDERFHEKFGGITQQKHDPNSLASIFRFGLADGNQQLPASGMCLQLDVEGFIDQYGTSFTAANAIEHIKSFFGLGLATLMFSVGTPKVLSSFGPTRRHIHVHRLDGEKISANTVFEADPDFSSLVGRIEVLQALSEAPNSQSYIIWCLGNIGTIFKAGMKSERVRRAAMWLFDSYQGANQLLSFVQTMTALEILLGDKKTSSLTGLTALLSNRCAYLLGQTHTERQEIMETLETIYDVRSLIVHTGKSRLSGKEQQLFFKLRGFCRRVIAKEMELLLVPQDPVVRALLSKSR